jgi:DegV family protein with EDD domain
MQVFFTVETLEFLHRGGRNIGASPFLGTALDFKPILTFNTEGKIDALERVRTNKKVIKRILTLAEEAANGQPVHAAVVHASIFQTADQLRLEALNCLNSLDMVTVEFSLVIGVHLGPGSVGIALYADSA